MFATLIGIDNSMGIYLISGTIKHSHDSGGKYLIAFL